MTSEELREARQKLGLTQKQFANLIGGSYGRKVRKWEAGEHAIPGVVASLVELLLDPRTAKSVFIVLVERHRREIEENHDGL